MYEQSRKNRLHSPLSQVLSRSSSPASVTQNSNSPSTTKLSCNAKVSRDQSRRNPSTFLSRKLKYFLRDLQLFRFVKMILPCLPRKTQNSGALSSGTHPEWRGSASYQRSRMDFTSDLWSEKPKAEGLES